jgi:hypothetical protein
LFINRCEDRCSNGPLARRLPTAHLAAPRAGFPASAFHNVFEALQIAFQARGDQTQRVAHVLDAALRLMAHRHFNQA